MYHTGTLVGLTRSSTCATLHPNNINRGSGIEIPEAKMPTIKFSTTGDR